ncbi:MAG TPA: polysaccharide pyruvyl transferase family protein [Paracoccus sp. (in: a-proteobacteria)]|uniref:polysaccharide pyruvyl transferase family protein n=1 Tax=Paracoccus sp. TaxID=267 RepID=UPI002BAD94B7|nr:polysaccharide pyruvyl transferase family protein [Paracoccus sp. (in: a-proteobacteria)]HWL57093.1 polysaccharide pyruvyl transferase family protein [Paracoccus sp. (in: a-proteobacteria)]
MKIGLLWQSADCGLYSNADFDSLYKKIGHNNGNLAFVHAVKSQIEAAEIKFYPWHVSPKVLNESVDYVVFPAANQLGNHTDLGGLAKSLAQVTKPIVAIGLGAQAPEFGADIELTEGTRAWLDVLIENGQRHGIQNIYTRGPYTSAQIQKLTGAETLANGCPSHFINPRPDLGKQIQQNWESKPLPQRIAVAGGHEAWLDTRDIEQQLIAMMMDPMFPGIYIVQSMGSMIKISRDLFDDIDPGALKNIHQHTVPHYTVDEFKIWARNYARSYYDVAAWMDELRRYDLLIGPRFHGAQLAIQAERMACTITVDTRTEEMCRETGVPYLRSSDLKEPLTRKRLKKLIKFDGAAYDKHRAMKCARYVDFLNGAGLKPAAYLMDIAAAGAPAKAGEPVVA